MPMKQLRRPERIVAQPLTIETDNKPLFTLKSLSDLGANLPIGIPTPGGGISRAFRLRPFKMKQEKALSRLKEESKGSTIGAFVREVLASMVQTVGPHNFDQMKDGERQVVINQLAMPDVLYLYLYLRFNSLGSDVQMRIRCGACTNEYHWWGDLGSLDVRVVNDDAGDLTRSFKLRDPFQLRGKSIDTLRLGLIKWDAFCNFKSGSGYCHRCRHSWQATSARQGRSGRRRRSTACDRCRSSTAGTPSGKR